MGAHYYVRTLRVDFVAPKLKTRMLMGRALCWAIDFTPGFLPDQLCDFGYDIMFFN